MKRATTKRQYKNALRALLNMNTTVILAPMGFRYIYRLDGVTVEKLERAARRWWKYRRRVVDHLAHFFAEIEYGIPNEPGYIYSWAIGSAYYKHGASLWSLAENYGVQFASDEEREAFKDLGGLLFAACEELYEDHGQALSVCPPGC